MYPYDQAGEILRAWPDVALSAPETVTPELLLWSVPADPAVPAELHGLKAVVVRAVYAGHVPSGGVYVNFSGLGEEASGLREATYGTSEGRLAAVRGVRSGRAVRGGGPAPVTASAPPTPSA